MSANRDQQILASRIAFADRLADAAGGAILPYFRQPIGVANKGGTGAYDPVTEADRGAETAIRSLLHTHYPDDAILGEEDGAVAGTSGFRWIIDPIDGTRAFVAGMPLWGTLIALEEKGILRLGILDQPFLKERFSGTSAETTLTDAQGTRILRTRACPLLSDAIVCTTHPLAHFDDAQRAVFERVESAARFSRYGGDCYAYAMLAMGLIDIVMEANLAHWDIAAIIPIVEGAGGVISDWQGRPVRDGGSVIATGDLRLHAGVLEKIAR